MRPLRPAVLASAVLLTLVTPAATAAPQGAGWQSAHATFYGGADAAGSAMGGACGYGNLDDAGIGIYNTALSTALFHDGASCGERFKVRCVDSSWCLPGQTAVTVTVTNFCPPNDSLPSDNGGWCNPPREHFDLSQPVYEKIAQYKSGIVPIEYSEADSDAARPLRFTITGNPYWNLVLVNSNSRWATQSVLIKGSNTDWMPMSRNWGANWQSGTNLVGQALSLKVTDTHGRVVVCDNVIPANWQFGQTFTATRGF